jgi:hypothetical protein
VAYDEDLADRVRAVLPPVEAVTERQMFGGLAFMLGGHMFCGVVRDTLMVRLGLEGADRALNQPHVRPMDFTGRPARCSAGGVGGRGRGIRPRAAAQASYPVRPQAPVTPRGELQRFGRSGPDCNHPVYQPNCCATRWLW